MGCHWPSHYVLYYQWDKFQAVSIFGKNCYPREIRKYWDQAHDIGLRGACYRLEYRRAMHHYAGAIVSP
jgi:hypothetical protein